MNDKFDIIDYLSGLTGFIFDKAVLKRIAFDRNVYNVESYEQLDTKTKDLLRADLLYVAYVSPNVWASSTHSHGSYSQTIGSQTIYNEEKERLYKMFMRIYEQYNDVMLSEVSASDSNLQWLDY
jgi:hypothetical protein